MSASMHEWNARAVACERWLRGLLIFGVGACILLTFAGVGLLTVGTDEAWLTLSALRVAGARAPVGSFPPELTSGGLFVALHALAGLVGGESIPLHRGVTLACWLLTLGFVWRIASRRAESGVASLLAVACVLSTRGSLVLAATSHAEVLAFLVVLGAWQAWEATQGNRPLRWIGCGALAGLAAATRAPALAWMPAQVLWAWLASGRLREQVADALAIAVVGVAVFLALSHAYVACTPNLPGATSAFLSASGFLGALFDYPRLLDRWMIADDLLPLVGIASIAVALWWTHPSGRRDNPASLVVYSVVVWVLWVLRAPVSHLRYLWPAMPCLWLAAGLVAAHVYATAKDAPLRRVTCLALVCAALIGEVGVHVRTLVNGSLDKLSWEYSREIPASDFRRFRAVSDQRAVARYLRETAAHGEVAALGVPYALRWASGVAIDSLLDHMESADDGAPARWATPVAARRIVLGPELGVYWHLRPEAYAWFESKCALERQFGDYAVYRVLGAYPEAAILQPRSVPMEHLPLALPRFAPGAR